MSIHFLARGVYDHPVEKVVQARVEKLHKQKESFLNFENNTTGKDGELDYNKRTYTFKNTIMGIFRKRLSLDEETISTQEEVWTEKSGRVTWIRSSWLSFADKFTWVEMEVYEPQAENSQKTQYERTAAAEVTATGIFGQATKFLLKSLMKQSFEKDANLLNDILNQ